MLAQPGFELVSEHLPGSFFGIAGQKLKKAQRTRPRHRHTGVFPLESMDEIAVSDGLIEVGRTVQPQPFIRRDKGVQGQDARRPHCQEKQKNHQRCL